jgi:hypothetical protein
MKKQIFPALAPVLAPVLATVLFMHPAQADNLLIAAKGGVQTMDFLCILLHCRKNLAGCLLRLNFSF